MADPTEPTPRQVYHSLLERLAEFRGQVRWRFVVEGLARVLAFAAALAALSYLLDRTFRLSVPARWAMVVAAGVTLLVVLWRHVVAPLRLRLDPLTLSAALDRMAGRTDGYLTTRVAAVLELPRALETPGATSIAMVQQAAAQCHRALTAVDLQTRLNDRRRNVAFAVAALAIALPTAAAVAAPATAKLWAERVLGGSHTPWPQKTYLRVVGVDGAQPIIVPRGEPYTLRVTAVHSDVIPDLVTTRYRDGTGNKIEANLTTFGPNDFRYEFPAVNNEVDAEVTGGDDTLGPITIRPIDRPRIADLKLIAQHPTEEKPTTYSFDGGTGDLSFLPQTKLRLEFTATVPIAEARVKSSVPAVGGVVERLDEKRFAVSWVAASAVQLEITLVGREAGLTSLPTAVSVGLKNDQPPRVTIGFTGVKSRVTTRAKVPITVDARDDYGLKQVAFTMKVETPDPAKPNQLKAETTTTVLYGPTEPTVDRETTAKQTIDLDPMKLPPGSLVTVTATATDACYTGPQTTLSRGVTFRVVPPEELFREILLRQQAERAKFRKQTDEAKVIRDAMTDAITAETIAELAKRHRALQREVTRIDTVLTESLTEMQLNALGTDEAYELMRRNVLSPLHGLGDDLLTPQKDALDGLKPGDPATLADVRDRQDKVSAKMTELLRQMSQWDSFVDVLNQLNEVIKVQESAQHKTTELKKKEQEGAFDK